MALEWKAVLPQDMCILSKTVISDHLAMASHLQLKVLLWFAANTCDVEACAKALHKSATAVQEATQYWLENGVLLSDDKPVQTAPTPSADDPPAPMPEVTARPVPVKPQMCDVILKQETDTEFSQLLHNASARLGKPISHGDMETLLYLYDTAGMPASMILMAIGYAVARGSANMRYVEKVVLGWQDSGITTFAAAEENLRLLEEMDAAALKVQKLTGKARALDYRQRGMAHTWLCVWQFPEEVVRLALEQAAKTTKPLIPYANAILNAWYEEGIKDAAAALATLEKQSPAVRKRGQQEKTSLDLPAYEKILEDYVPSFPPKKREE